MKTPFNLVEAIWQQTLDHVKGSKNPWNPRLMGFHGRMNDLDSNCDSLKEMST